MSRVPALPVFRLKLPKRYDYSIYVIENGKVTASFGVTLSLRSKPKTIERKLHTLNKINKLVGVA